MFWTKPSQWNQWFEMYFAVKAFNKVGLKLNHQKSSSMSYSLEDVDPSGQSGSSLVSGPAVRRRDSGLKDSRTFFFHLHISTVRASCLQRNEFLLLFLQDRTVLSHLKVLLFQTAAELLI